MCSKNYNNSVFIHGTRFSRAVWWLCQRCGVFRRSDLADDVSKMISRRESVSGRPRWMFKQLCAPASIPHRLNASAERKQREECKATTTHSQAAVSNVEEGIIFAVYIPKKPAVARLFADNSHVMVTRWFHSEINISLVFTVDSHGHICTLCGIPFTRSVAACWQSDCGSFTWSVSKQAMKMKVMGKSRPLQDFKFRHLDCKKHKTITHIRISACWQPESSPQLNQLFACFFADPWKICFEESCEQISFGWSDDSGRMFCQRGWTRM